MVDRKFHDAVIPRKNILTNSRNLKVSHIMSSLAIKMFKQTHQLVPGSRMPQDFTIDAHLLSCFQAKRSTSPVQIMPGSLMVPFPSTPTVQLTYNDEGYLDDREREPEYIRKTLGRMFDGVKSYVEDFVFRYKPFKNIVQISTRTEGNLLVKRYPR